MTRENLILVFAHAMALACSGMVLADAPAIRPQGPHTVQVGANVTLTGKLAIATYPAPIPSQPIAIATLNDLTTNLFELLPNDGLRPINTMMLRDGGVGVDLVKLASVLAPEKKVEMTGTYMHFIPTLVQKDRSRPRMDVDAIQVTKIMIDGISIVVPTPQEAQQIQKIASRNLLQYIHELHPNMADGPEARVDSVEILSNDHAIVNLHFVGGWTHQTITGSNARVLVVLSGDDEIRVLEGQLN